MYCSLSVLSGFPIASHLNVLYHAFPIFAQKSTSKIAGKKEPSASNSTSSAAKASPEDMDSEIDEVSVIYFANNETS